MTEKKIILDVKGIVVKDGKFLAMHQSGGGKTWWTVPGGIMHYGEEPEEALRREVLEETCLDVEVVRPIGVYQFFRYYDGAHFVCVTFLCEHKSGEVNIDNNPDAKADALSNPVWITPGDFLKKNDLPVSDGLRKIISELKLQ